MKMVIFSVFALYYGLSAQAEDLNCDAKAIAASRSEVISVTGRPATDLSVGRITSKWVMHDDYPFINYNVRFTARDNKVFEVTAMLTFGCEIEEIRCWDQNNDFCRPK